MDFSAIAAISARGMYAEQARMDVSAMNLANMHTSRPAGVEPYAPLRVVSQVANPSFRDLMDAVSNQASGPEVTGVAKLQVPPRLVFEPGHPNADERGFVAYPGVDSVAEMVQVMSAVRAYEANITALNAAKAMAVKALEIGGRN